MRADVSRNIMTTSMNKRTHLFRKIYLTLYSRKGCERVDVGCVGEVSWRREQTATYWLKVLLTIAALLPHFAQPWGTESPSPVFGAGPHSAGILSPTATGTELTDCLKLQLTQAVCGTWLYNCLMPTSFLWAYAFAPNSTTSTGQGDIPISLTGCTCYLHRCIS